MTQHPFFSKDLVVAAWDGEIFSLETHVYINVSSAIRGIGRGFRCEETNAEQLLTRAHEQSLKNNHNIEEDPAFENTRRAFGRMSSRNVYRPEFDVIERNIDVNETVAKGTTIMKVRLMLKICAKIMLK